MINNHRNDFRVTTNVFAYGDADWFNKCEEIVSWCQENVTGEITTVPGEIPGEVCWIFDNADAAFWFTMRWKK